MRGLPRMHKPVPGKPGTYAPPRTPLRPAPLVHAGQACATDDGRRQRHGRVVRLDPGARRRGSPYRRPCCDLARPGVRQAARQCRGFAAAFHGGTSWLADTPALELRCGLPRWYMRGRPALRMTDAVRDMPGVAVGSGRAAARQAVPAPLFRLGAAGRSAGRAAVPRVCCCLPWRDFNGLRILRPGPPWPGVRDRARQWRASAVAHPLGWWVRCSFCRCSRATRV